MLGDPSITDFPKLVGVEKAFKQVVLVKGDAPVSRETFFLPRLVATVH